MAHNEQGLRPLRDPESPRNRLGGIGARRRSRKSSLHGQAHGFSGCLMAIMVSDVYEALVEAGASEAKAKVAAEAI